MSVDPEVAGTVALITDVEYRKALPIIRALGRAGVRVVGVSRHAAPLGAFSRYCDRVLRCPDYTARPEAFLAWLQALLRREHFDVLYPIEDRSLALCAHHPAVWQPHVNALIPTGAALESAYDKWKTIQCASSLSIPVPATHCPESEEEMEALAACWQGPAVIKPRKSSGSRGLRFVEDGSELVAAYREVSAAYPRPLIQEKVPAEGQGLGVFALLNAQHRPVALFGHRRLREYPVTGGPSTLRESYRDDALIAQSLRLLQAMQITGVAMVEYKRDPRTGVPILMEVNPRFWGSLQLAVLAGVNFPLLYHELALGIEVEPVLDFRVGMLCRWLWPGDILHFLTNPDRLAMEPSFFRFRQPGTGYDIVSAEDPLPMIGVVLEGLRKLLRGER